MAFPGQVEPSPKRGRLSRVHQLTILFIGLAIWYGPALAKEPCSAPLKVCTARDAVFRISSFNPYGSAVRIGPNLLVTSRHLVVDEQLAKLHMPDGSKIDARVLASSYEGDLVLLEAQLPQGPVLPLADVFVRGDLFTVGYDLSTRGVRVYSPGRLIIEPAPKRPFARLHHTAHTQPGNSGGALVDDTGRLVGIAASGGEGRFEAIPATEIAKLRANSGELYEKRGRLIGQAYRACMELLEQARPPHTRVKTTVLEELASACKNTGNRQLIDLAAQTLGRNGDVAGSIVFFEKALDRDPHAINSRLGLVVSLHMVRAYEQEREHLRFLMSAIPGDPMVHRYAVQVGKFTGDDRLTKDALKLIEAHNPRALPAAKRFLESKSQPQRQAPRKQ